MIIPSIYSEFQPICNKYHLGTTWNNDNFKELYLSTTTKILESKGLDKDKQKAQSFLLCLVQTSPEIF